MMQHRHHETETPVTKTKWITKIVLGLVTISFAFWGVSGYLQSSASSETLVEIGDIKVTKDYFQKRMQPIVQNLQKKVPNFSQALFVETGLAKQFLETIIIEILEDLEIQHLGLTIDDQMLRRELRAAPELRTADGKLDTQKLAQYLKQEGISEQKFFQTLRTNLLQQQLLMAIQGNFPMPKGPQSKLLQSLMEERALKIITIPHKTLARTNKPTEGDLKAFYEGHKDAYLHPEYRQFTVLEIPADTLKTAPATEAELQVAYKASLTKYTLPEQRGIEILTLKESDVFDPKKASDYKGRFVNIGQVTQDSLEAPIATAAFTTAKGGYSAPIVNDGEQQIIHVLDVVPGSVQSYQQVKKELAKTYGAEKEDKDSQAFLRSLEDEIAGGKSLEEVAKERNLKILKAPFMTQEMVGKDGKKVTIKGLTEAMTKTAYATEEKTESLTMDGNNHSHYIVHVSDVIAAGHTPFEKVKDRVLAAWAEDQQKKKAQEVGNQIVADLKAGKTPGLKNYPTRGIEASRERVLKELKLPGKTVNALFELAPQQGMMVETKENVLVIIAGNARVPKTSAKEQEQNKKALYQYLKQDIAKAYIEALKEKYGVRIHEHVFQGLGETPDA